MRFEPSPTAHAFLFGLILLFSLAISACGSSDSSGSTAVQNPDTPTTQSTGTRTYSFGGNGEVITSENFRMKASKSDTIAEKRCGSENFRLYPGYTYALSRKSSH